MPHIVLGDMEIEKLTITLFSRIDFTGRVIYQWQGSDNKNYSPILDDLAKALCYPEQAGLRPIEPQ